MFELMKLAIGLLKERVAVNLETIKKNEREFQKMLTSVNSNGNTDEMNHLLETNEALLAENFDFINLQLSILKFIENQQNPLAEMANENKTATDNPMLAVDLLGYTANGKIPFDHKHPLLYDEYFWGRLIQHHYLQDQDEQVRKILNTIALSKRN